MAKKMSKVNLVVPIVAVAVVIVVTILITLNRPKSMKEPAEVSNRLGQPFTASATIRLENMTAVADINRTNPQEFTFRMTEPAALKDLTFGYNGTDMNVSYKGMGVNIADDSLIAKGIGMVVMNAVNSAADQTGVRMHEKDGALFIEGKNDDGEFTLKLDKKNGSLISLSVPTMDFECEFTDFIFTAPEQAQPEGGAETPAESQAEQPQG